LGETALRVKEDEKESHTVSIGLTRAVPSRIGGDPNPNKKNYRLLGSAALRINEDEKESQTVVSTSRFNSNPSG